MGAVVSRSPRPERGAKPASVLPVADPTPTGTPVVTARWLRCDGEAQTDATAEASKVASKASRSDSQTQTVANLFDLPSSDRIRNWAEVHSPQFGEQSLRRFA